MVTKWENRVYFHKLKENHLPSSETEQELNKLGEEGWELASLTRDSTEEAGFEFTFFLKRPAVNRS